VLTQNLLNPTHKITDTLLFKKHQIYQRISFSFKY